MKRIALLVVLVVACAGVAGCASLSVNAKVNPDASVSNYTVTIETTSTVYGLVGDQLKSKFDLNNMTYDERRNGDNVTMTFTARNALRSNDPANWTIQKANNRMVYVDKRFTSLSDANTTNQISAAMLQSVSLNYRLEMPGKITSSNANTVENTRAEWHLQGNALSTPIRAESEAPVTLPGFEAILALAGITGALLVANRRR